MSKPFKLKSGNSPLFKNMGSSPAKEAESEFHTHNDHHDPHSTGSSDFPTRGRGPAKTGSPAKQKTAVGEAVHLHPGYPNPKEHPTSLKHETFKKLGSPAKQGMMGAVDPDTQMAQAGVEPQALINIPTYKKGSPAKHWPGKHPSPKDGHTKSDHKEIRAKKKKIKFAPKLRHVPGIGKKTGAPAKQQALKEFKKLEKPLSKMPFYSAQRIAEYKRRGWAMDETTHKTLAETCQKFIKNTKEKASSIKAPLDKTGSPAKIYNKPKGKRTEY